MTNEVTTILATVVAIMSLTFNGLQFKHALEQARALGQRGQSEMAYSLVRWLEEPHNLSARNMARSLPDYVNRESWTDTQRNAALQVVNLYQLAALFDETGALPPYFLTYFYGPSLARTWKNLGPWIIQELRGGDPHGNARVELERAAANPLITTWFGSDYTEDNRPRPFSMVWQAAEKMQRATKTRRQIRAELRGVLSSWQ